MGHASRLAFNRNLPPAMSSGTDPSAGRPWSEAEGEGWRPSRNRMPGARILAAAGAVLAALGVAALVAAAVGMRSAASPAAGRLLQVMALSVPAQRELENFQVSLDGKIIAREPNGDVIDMEPVGWRKWLQDSEEAGAQRELENFQVADGKIIALEPNGDVIDVSPPAWRDWIKNVEAGRD